MTPEVFQLSLAQQFESAKFREGVPKMSREQLESVLIEAHTLLMIRQNIIKHLARDAARGYSLEELG